jgi:hypothetical protein
MTDRKPNFVLIPDTEEAKPRPKSGLALVFDRLRALTEAARGFVVPAEQDTPTKPRLVFGFDATASREPAWETARHVTDALVQALPGELDVALAVHGGSRLHTFTAFTSDARTLRDLAASITCKSGFTRLLPILSGSLAHPGVRVVTYTGDFFEESLSQGRKLADRMGRNGIKLIVLHDTSDWNARRDAEIFLDLARRTGGCVLPFDATAPSRLRDMLAAVAVYAVGGLRLLHEKRQELAGAPALLRHLGDGGTDR